MRACMRACVRACMHTCTHAYAHVYVLYAFKSYLISVARKLWNLMHYLHSHIDKLSVYFSISAL